MRPFPIYPLYTQTVILSLDKPIADCFLFRPRKSRKSAGNAVIPTFPTHWPHGLQHLRHKRRNVRFEGLRRVHTLPQPLTAHTAAYTAKQGAFRVGALLLPSERFARFGNPARPGVRTANFAAFRSWSRVLPKNAESLWDSDALMRVAVPRRRGPAGLLRCCIPRRIDHLRGLSPPHRCAEKELPSASRVGLSHQPCLHPASRSGFV